ncbi:ferredoxin-thioredoxin reductase, variable chain-like [Coffea eugenioides]|uniref:Ferredoxin-thioredoxin reductase, variable chain n=1 Tax=Coffea arabica TaxID=13443 RepID=A0A6P6WJ24_COFAR|nr:ferredoxin-thioredoxin reductase, variable chain-like [Coffea arabica]XP_027159357.1 ferredoxin-thioredoxin reductase, variable chain-like [Coffea eugenioides]
MTTSSSFFSSSILNIPISKTNSLIIPSPRIPSLDNPFARIKFPSRNCTAPIKCSSDSSSTTVVEAAETSSNSVKSSNSDSKDSVDGVYDEKAAEAQGKFGARVRVKVPLKVYHVPKVPETDLNGRIGFLKQYVAVHKGKKISANLPYKVEFVEEHVEGKKGPVKFFAHLKEDEFEYLD